MVVEVIAISTRFTWVDVERRTSYLSTPHRVDQRWDVDNTASACIQ